MEKKIFKVTGMAVMMTAIMSSCTQSIEDRAGEVIENELKTKLEKPFEILALSLDSCFADDLVCPAMAESEKELSHLYGQYLFCKEKAEFDSCRMIECEGRQRDIYKASGEDNKQKADALKGQVLEQYKSQLQCIETAYSAEHEFTGYRAMFSFKQNGVMYEESGICFFNPNLKKPQIYLHEDVMGFGSEWDQELRLEFEEELIKYGL